MYVCVYIYIDIHVYTHTSRHEEYYPPLPMAPPEMSLGELPKSYTFIYIYMNIWGGAKTKCATP